MITIMFLMKIKQGEKEEFEKSVITQLINSARSKNSVYYAIYQSLENSQEFILYEKWKNKNEWEGHLNNLIKIFGEKAEGSILPRKLEDYFEATESISYKED